MKAESNIYPEKITIERYADKADIILTENVTAIIREEQTAYQYDSYRVTVTDRANLETSIAENFEQWLALAKNEPVKIPTLPDRVATVENTQDEMVDVLATALGVVI